MVKVQIVYGSEMYHYGIPGMKWGHRKAILPTVSIGRRRGSTQTNSIGTSSQDQKARTSERRKKALKVGVAVAGTALAAYGTYKLAKFAQDKRYAAASKKAENYLKSNIFTKEKTFNVNGKKRTIYKNSDDSRFMVDNLSRRESRKLDKVIKKSNYMAVNKANDIYFRNTNTKFDRGLANVVNAGDSVGRAVKTTGRVAVNTGRTVGKVAKTTGKVAVGTGRTVGKVAKTTGKVVKTAAKRPKTTAAVALTTAAILNDKKRKRQQRQYEQQNRYRY